jgi:hypothetical protein
LPVVGIVVSFHCARVLGTSLMIILQFQLSGCPDGPQLRTHVTIVTIADNSIIHATVRTSRMYLHDFTRD